MRVPNEYWIFLTSSVLIIYLMILTWKLRRQRLGSAFILLLVGALLWSGSYLAEITAPALAVKVWAARVGFVGITLLPPAWLNLAQVLKGERHDWRYWLAVCLVPILTNVIVLLAPVPNAFWGPFALQDTPAGFTVLSPHYNGWFYGAHVPVGYLTTLASLVTLVRGAMHRSAIYRKQAGMLVLAMVLPTLTDLAHVLGISPLPDYNLTTAVFSLSGVIMLFALFRYRLLDLLPLARGLVIDNLSEMVIVLDANHRVVDLNRAATQSGLLPVDLFGKPIAYADTPLGKAVNHQLASGLEQQDITLQEPREAHFEIRLTQILDPDQERLGKIILVRNIDERVALFRQVRELAIRDSLTQVYNRGYFLELGEYELERTRRFGDRSLALMMLDLDNFKQINDTWGHQAGDQALIHVMDVSRQYMRVTDSIGRIGGDEFAILLPETDTWQALAVAERIRAALRPLPTPDGEIPVRVSFGVASLTGELAAVETLESLIEAADQALYQAKEQGRDRVICIEMRGAVAA